MAHIDHHPNGSFCWIELSTSDQAAAKTFYESLFGWTPNDMPMGPGEFYTIFRIEGRDAAAGYTLRKEQVAQHVPPNWILYIQVENVDASAAKVSQLGGTVVVAPFDVFDAGRMAVIADPTGAHFCLWQPNRSKGTGIAHVPGTLCWADLSTPDPKRAGEFYAKLLEWQILDDEKGTGYLHIKNGEHFIGGIPPTKTRPPGVPAHWLPYFWVDDVDASAAKAKQLGANVCLPPTSLEDVGRLAVIADPQGAVFAIFKSAH